VFHDDERDDRDVDATGEEISIPQHLAYGQPKLAFLVARSGALDLGDNVRAFVGSAEEVEERLAGCRAENFIPGSAGVLGDVVLEPRVSN
jgi:hypothetical protein